MKNHVLSRRAMLAATSVAAVSAALAAGCSPLEDSGQSESSSGQSLTRIEHDPDVKVIRTVCAPNCAGTCGINAFVKDNTILKVEPAEFSTDPYMRRICAKGISFAMQKVTHADRIKYPMRRVGERGAGEWERISWDEAMDEIVTKFNEYKEQYGTGSVAFVDMTGSLAAVNYGIPARICNLWGGTSIAQNGLMGDGAMSVALFPALGRWDCGSSWQDMMGGTKTLITVAANLSETMMNDFRYIMDAQEQNGMHYIALDPRLSHSASKADTWVPLRPGTDAALLLGMVQHIIENDWHDKDFLHDYTNAPMLIRSDTGKMLRLADIGEEGDGFVGWSEGQNAPKQPEVGDDCALLGTYKVAVEGKEIECTTAFQLLVDKVNAEYTPEQASEISEIDAAVIRDIAKRYAVDGPSAIRLGQGAQRYWQGHLSIIGAIVLAEVCGNIGREHAGIHWCGGGNLDATWPPTEWSVPDPSVEIPAGTTGVKMFDRLRSDEPFPIKALWFMQYNIGTQCGRRKDLFEEVFPALDLIICSDLVMSPGAEYADIVLPVTSFYEEPGGDMVAGITTKVIQYRNQVLTPLWEEKSDWEIGCLFAEKIGKLDLWTATGETIADNADWYIENSIHEGLRTADWEGCKATGAGWLGNEQPWVDFKDLKFDTPTGRAQLYYEDWYELGEAVPCFKEPHESNRSETAKTYPLTFMNCHGFHSVHSQHVGLPWISEFIPEPRIECNPVDAAARGLSDGDMVRVFNDRSSFKVRLQVTEGIKPGCLNMWQGWWPRHFEDGVHFAELLHYVENPAHELVTNTNFSPYDNLVEIERA